VLNLLIALTHAINYLNCALISGSIRQICLCCMLPSANDYTCHLQDVTRAVKLAIKQFY